jgi:hypothetical protein
VVRESWLKTWSESGTDKSPPALCGGISRTMSNSEFSKRGFRPDSCKNIL